MSEPMGEECVHGLVHFYVKFVKARYVSCIWSKSLSPLSNSLLRRPGVEWLQPLRGRGCGEAELGYPQSGLHGIDVCRSQLALGTDTVSQGVLLEMAPKLQPSPWLAV